MLPIWAFFNNLPPLIWAFFLFHNFSSSTRIPSRNQVVRAEDESPISWTKEIMEGGVILRTRVQSNSSPDQGKLGGMNGDWYRNYWLLPFYSLLDSPSSVLHQSRPPCSTPRLLQFRAGGQAIHPAHGPAKVRGGGVMKNWIWAIHRLLLVWKFFL